ncbi:MAG: aminodeoxychorismate/anthranilate synthase component II [Bacteroidota bacterium]|nr:aminodeoxychorismate/anthranilate synthase component II [Bacteroidota bacterium]
MNKILLIDNYDSFTYNLVHLLEQVEGVEVDVFYNNKISLNEVNNYASLVLSPGAGVPRDAGIMPQLLNEFKSSKKILGVCLGMQAIAEAFGANLKNLNTVYHGIATPITILDKTHLFKDCPDNFAVGRYHSWVIDKSSLPKSIHILAEDSEKNIMAIRHINFNICGVQFHPESILSEYGLQIIKNWIHD